MRGILVQSLVSRGVPFDLALETATQIRDQLGAEGRGEVSRDELSALVRERIEARVPLEARPLPPVRVLWVRDSHGTAQPFSKGLLTISLEGSGMESGDAHDVARALERRLLLEGRQEIERGELRERVAQAIEASSGAPAAARYRVMRRAASDHRPLFLLVGGSSGVGKTSIAVEVARRLEIARVIGTDMIRQVMRLMFSPDLMPEIHCSTYDAHERLALDPNAQGDPVILGFREQAQKIAVGVRGLLDRAVEESTSMLIEGVNLLPTLVELDRYRESAHVIFLAVAALDRESLKSRFAGRAKLARERQAERYLKHLPEIMTIQDHIMAEADQAGLPIIENVQFDAAVRAAIRSVIATLDRSLSAGDEQRKPPGRLDVRRAVQ
jgi:2-phosphoglycerate kinase